MHKSSLLRLSKQASCHRNGFKSSCKFVFVSFFFFAICTIKSLSCENFIIDLGLEFTNTDYSSSFTPPKSKTHTRGRVQFLSLSGRTLLVLGQFVEKKPGPKSSFTPGWTVNEKF